MAVAQRENADPELVESLSNELQVTPQTPPTFLFHTTSDPVVPVGNSVLFYMALRKAGVPAEMHIYEEGPHGRRPGRRRSGALLLAGAPGCLDAVVRRLSSPPKIAAVGATRQPLYWRCAAELEDRAVSAAADADRGV